VKDIFCHYLNDKYIYNNLLSFLLWQVFGGRDWALTGNVGGMSPPDNGTLRRGASTKFKKKKSIGNIQALKVNDTV
jgi:hypothetical protein